MRQKFKALGGEMELAPQTLTAPLIHNILSQLPSHQTVATGRTGIKLILQAIKEELNGVFLLPAYLCSSVLKTFQEEKIEIAFYNINSDLSLDLKHLIQQVDIFYPKGILFINYFGFPVAPKVKEALLNLKQQCWLIEDCVQGSLVEPTHPVVGEIGHFSLTSFRKYLPLPDGGLVINNTQNTLADLPRILSKFVRYRLFGKFLRYEFIHHDLNSSELEEIYLNLFAVAERELDTQIPMQGMSEISQDLLKRLNLSDAMERRRSNFLFMLQAFAETPKLQSLGVPLIAQLPEGVSPLVFPLRVREKKRDQLSRQLQSQKVFCPIHWHLPQEVQVTEFPEAHQISKEILSLPIDQRYNKDDMNSLIDQLLIAYQNI